MRYLAILFLSSLIGFACVKPKTKNPVPVLAYVDFAKSGKSPYTNQDTALLVYSYEDGDGNLFRDATSDGSNIVISTYEFNSDSNKFIPGINISYVLLQPDNGYYKGKSIQGQISVPMNQYRTSDKIKKIKLDFFMVDMDKHKSNVVSSPTISLNF